MSVNPVENDPAQYGASGGCNNCEARPSEHCKPNCFEYRNDETLENNRKGASN